uniref:Glutathione transferase n=1 Tax=Chromulina nebulosa TaxID=96789 RepID=A0A7S0XE51_9STRA|mmetsp:Transcript_4155/g.3726  ORF Transcript_4155/g.3726 Transcript_4155/m.3726 type:complete len:209 (+) Transcript_4155:52-678(+)
MATYKLTYFNLRGLAEITRIMFNIAKVPFEDIRLEYPPKEFAELKAAGKFAANLNRVPILDYNGVQIGQSKAIERFVAKKLGFMGTNDIEEAQVDMMCEHVRDIRIKYNEIRFNKSGEELEAAKKNFIVNDLGVWLEKLENVVPNSIYSVGDKLSLADINIYLLILDFFTPSEEVEKAKENCPKLKAIANNVAEVAKDWLASRPVTMF